MKAKWSRKIDSETGAKSNWYYVKTSQGLVLVSVKSVGELDLSKPKSAETLNKFVESNTARSSEPDEQGRVSHFFGDSSNLEQSVGEAKFTKFSTAAPMEAVQCEITEV